MNERIRQRALALGFDQCRFTTAEPPARAGTLQDWLAEGCHGQMSYLASNAAKRVDPAKVLPGAKSLVVVAASYAMDEPARGVVARYAQFLDYHQVLGRALRALSEEVTRLGGTGARSLWHVDTGPILERELAERAGVGFVGKHTNLISRQLGNWFFLGEIITTVPLEPDAPEKNRCGSCLRCLAACPTGAITAPFRLDARRCISYLTIELRSAIPVEFRPAIGTRVFGCDDCLAACPWNRFAREGRLLKGCERGDLRQLDLLELVELDEPGFRQRFAETPIWRVKRRGLVRNVCVALGNARDERALPALDRASRDPDSLIAEHALWALEQFRGT